jgi:hypothetical protein
MPNFPNWLHSLAIGSILVAAACSAIIIVDEIRYPQKMWIMNLVWPITALFGSIVWLVLYFAFGRQTKGRKTKEVSMPVAVAKGASHCGAGCTLGDLIVEWAAVAFPGIAILFGWHSLFAERTFAVWIPDYLVAFLIGIMFQYFTIAPMRNLGVGEGIWAAIKADFSSITAWQVGMYGGMAIGQFAWFRPAYGNVAEPNSVEFWFLMQIAMIAGFLTAYPVNWWLISAGLKEKM